MTVTNDISEGLGCIVDQTISLLLTLCCTNQTAEKYALQKSILESARVEAPRPATERGAPFDVDIVEL